MGSEKKAMIRSRVLLLTAMLALPGTAKVYAASGDSWQFEAAPYLWAINMNGRVQVGSQSAHVKQSFSDILSHFDGGAMLYIGAKKDKLGLFINALYTELSQTTYDGPLTIDATNKFGIFSAGASWEVFNRTFPNASQIIIEPYLGARYTMNNATLKVSPDSISVSNNQGWTDPIVGARCRYNINRAWQAILAGDVGGTNFNNHNSYNINALIGYKPQTMLKNATFYAGYRLLYQDYVTGSGPSRFSWDMKLFGPEVGVSILF